jgi:hypothetical protein
MGYLSFIAPEKNQGREEFSDRLLDVDVRSCKFIIGFEHENERP